MKVFSGFFSAILTFFCHFFALFCRFFVKFLAFFFGHFFQNLSPVFGCFFAIFFDFLMVFSGNRIFFLQFFSPIFWLIFCSFCEIFGQFFFHIFFWIFWTFLPIFRPFFRPNTAGFGHLQSPTCQQAADGETIKVLVRGSKPNNPAYTSMSLGRSLIAEGAHLLLLF